MNLPLKDITVLEFTHVVMGPVVGLILAELGAEVIHVEPITGDRTRELAGFGAGFFSFYNRNKKSLAIDIKLEKGKEIIYQLVQQVDVVVENYGPGTFERLGYGYETLQDINDRIIYCSLKGFLKGPYENRIGMDEIVQMMGGLAYMTGRQGDPLRAGTSILDITGGMFGVIGILSALHERNQTGKGKSIKASLFETCAFTLGQFMACLNDELTAIPPMPSRNQNWSVYQLFKSVEGEQVFIGIISDKQWKKLCDAFEWIDMLEDERLKNNNARMAHQDYLIPELSKRLGQLPKSTILSKCLSHNIPHALVRKPEDLYKDPHLLAGGHLVDTTLINGYQTKLPKLPIEFENEETVIPVNPPRIGEHSNEILRRLKMDDDALDLLREEGVIVC